MKKLLTVIIVASCLFANTSLFADESVCNCNNNVQAVDFIVTGRVEKITPVTASKYIVDILVYSSWKEVKSPKITILSYLSPKNCSFEFITGDEYLIYGFYSSFENHKIINVSKCGKTQELKKIKQNVIEELGKPIYVSHIIN